MSLVIGDCRAALARWAAEGVRVQCVVTSPPYWGLRNYGTAPLVWDGDPVCPHEWGEPGTSGQRNRNGQGGALDGGDGPEMLHPSTGSTCLRCGAWRGHLGLEPTPELYVAHMVEVFSLVRDVLADDGTCWINLGDSYASGNTGRNDTDRETPGGRGGSFRGGARQPIEQHTGLKPKNLVGIPWRVAFALQADGWYLRSDIIWVKPNPMPESVTDRPTKAHEYVFLLSKRATYYYDAESIKEPSQTDPRENYPARAKVLGRGAQEYPGEHQDKSGGYPMNGAGRNRRSVWTIATAPYPEAHFATFPPDLVKPCILAGSSERGCCPVCGRQWQRVVERTAMVIDRSGRTHPMGRTRTSGTMLEPPTSKTVGWEPGCACGRDPVPSTVLDMFMGSGTVAMVAQDLGRRWLGCELSPEYARLCERRTRQAGLVL